jgi:hypothetical protein
MFSTHLTSRSVRTYPRDLSNLDWTIWTNTGEPQTRLLIVDKGDDELSRSEFAPDGASDGGRQTWISAEEVTYEYVRDAAGNTIKEIRRQRPSPDKPFRDAEGETRLRVKLRCDKNCRMMTFVITRQQHVLQ